MKGFRFFVAGWVMASLLGTTASAQSIELLWAKRKAPWPVPVPASLDTTKAATDTAKNPYLTVYQATVSPNGAAVIVCPGGGYEHLSSYREGRNVATKFNGYGVSAFVLRYRFGVVGGGKPYQHPIEMWDAQRAVRWVRANAARFGIDPNRVGIIGFSAGGHLATTVATRYDAGNPDVSSMDYYPGAKDSIDGYSCKPDFQILGYPVINMDSSIAHAGSVNALIGPNPSSALKTTLSNERQVTSATPPAFITADTNDATVPIRNSRNYADSLKKHGVAGKLLQFTRGGHGFGLADGVDGAVNFADVKLWPDSARAWMQLSGFLTPTTGVISKMRVQPQAKSGGNHTVDLLGRRLSVRSHFPFFKVEKISGR